jgi:DNA-binding transcriptional ArsR family regulator
MAGPEPRSNDELSEIKARLAEIQDSLRRFQPTSRPIDQHAHPPARSDILEVMVSQVMDDVEEGLSRNMVRRCEMREPCRSTFMAFLQKNASLLEHDTVREEIIITNQDELDRLRETSPYDKCTKCFNEVSRLFGKQIRLMRSMRIYSTASDKRHEIEELQEDDFVKTVLEPIASKHRLQILKAVSQETKTFSSLAETTGLRGGNLLFHVQRLLDAGMVVQRRDRGDYLITEKGFKVLKGVSDVHQLLK